MRNHDLAARRCGNCHRVFSKVEHLRRHQRSHTGERPFHCAHCGRNYARSDVLNRHIRHHHPATDGPSHPDQAPNSPTVGQMLHPHPQSQLDVDGDDADSESPAAACRMASASPRISAPVEGSSTQSRQNRVCTNDQWHDIHFDVLQEMSPSRLGGLSGFLDDGPDVTMVNGQASEELEPLLSSRQELNPSQSFIDLSFGPQELLNDQGSANIIAPELDFEFVLPDGLLLTPPGSGDQPVNPSAESSISNDQFDQVRRLWPTRRRAVTSTPSPLSWDDILLHPEDNIFSSTSLKALASLDPLSQSESSWKFTVACRNRLTQTISPNYTAQRGKAMQAEASPEADGPWTNGLPPTDILDMCLDLYFYRFQVHMPFVHAGTFNASETPGLLLFPMCIVGLMFLDKAVARKLILRYLPSVIQHCRTELASQALRHCPGSTFLTVLASGSLLLFIAASTAELAFEEERQALYEEMVSLARDRKLFHRPSFSSTLIQAVNDPDVTWKAWARIESAQRLTACLLLTDVYSAQMLGVPPVLSPGEIQVPIIGPDDVFTVFNSKKWTALIGSQDPWNQVLSMAADSENYIQDLTGFGLQVVLAMTWLRILKSQRSVHSVSDIGTSHSSLQAHDTNASCLPFLIKAYGGSLMNGNGNSLILWHYIGLCMTTNLSTIEDAAGRNGPEAAKSAVDSLKTWANSPAARRACLHAIHALTASSHQRLSGGVMLHTEMALFTAALVLVFYIFTAPRFDTSDHTPCYDLFEDVDWAEVGNAGLGPLISSSSPSSSTCAATIFIQNGGPITFRGAEYHNPYGAARRAFMNYAAHLKDIGRWNVEEYCKVLHIISDTLFASETGDLAA
ncbi:hypothetical protein BJX66DRAFT_346690 [Aspergillus keveii]|uniref:C2H2-type domain-containing protein n=1 Tax=Aspergillus keveii TaxID=714993 RepID=A0ABR4FTS4_9EURO